MAVIILFTGLSATGKSTIANRLGEEWRISVLGEREILHNLALSRGFARTRYWIAEVGLEAALDEALSETIRAIEEKKNERGLILDGSYDRRLPQVLEEAFGKKVVVISVTAEEDLRRERIRKRMGVSSEEAEAEMKLIDTFKYSAGLEDIMKKAALTVENNQTIGEPIREIRLNLDSEINTSLFVGERLRG